jgi:hypothetical protein
MINECLQSFDVMEGTVKYGPWRLCWWTPKYIGDIIDMWVSIQKKGCTSWSMKDVNSVIVYGLHHNLSKTTNKLISE